MKVILGIDVSSDKLDACVVIDGDSSAQSKVFKNTENGCKKLLLWAKQRNVSKVILESTGGYEKKASRILSKNGLETYVVSPSRIKYFAKGVGQIAKNDRVDAYFIAQYGLLAQIKPTAKVEPELIEMKELVTRRNEIVRQIQAEKSRLSVAGTFSQKSIERIVKALEKEKIKIEKHLEKLPLKSETLQEKYEVLMAQKGVGKITAYAILALLPELGILNRKQIAALAGLAPYSKDSGKKQGKRFIQGGRGAVRTALYMPAWVLVQSDDKTKKFYEKLIAAGKAPKVAIVAVMRKFLVKLNWTMKHHINTVEA